VPELPEVETVRRGLNHATLANSIVGGEVLLDRTIAYPTGAEFLAGLVGCTIRQWSRRGKYLLAELTSGKPVSTDSAQLLPVCSASSIPTRPAFLGVHLRMSGQLLWVTRDQPLQKHTRVRLFFDNRQELRFVDQRTFGQLWWVPLGIAPELVITGLQRLGPEPFSDEFSVGYFQDQLQRRRRPIKSALLDQAIVAGMGNIYADEALFLSQIHPTKLCVDLSRPQIQRLHANVIQVLQDSIEAKGTTFSSFRSVEGVNGNYGGMAWVYGRDGDRCRNCDTLIERLKLVGRSAHFCPKCQQ
jgi:formamidopyrimidine-DNA glycosylase